MQLFHESHFDMIVCHFGSRKVHFFMACAAVMRFDAMFHFCTSIEVTRSVSNNTAR